MIFRNPERSRRVKSAAGNSMKNAKIKIRDAEKKDKDKISELFYKLNPDIKTRKTVQLGRLRARDKIFVAEENNQIIGFIWISYIWYRISSTGYIENLYIEKKCRGRSIGRRLVNRALKYFKRLKSKVIIVVSVGKKELKFYDKLGFRKSRGYWLYKKPQVAMTHAHAVKSMKKLVGQ